MRNFEKNVPFDPGYSKVSFSFIEQIAYIVSSYEQTKTPHQRKFHLTKLEPMIIKIMQQSTSFYLGCMLWGGFIRYRFDKSPKEIVGNNTLTMSEEELKELDCGAEARIILQYINTLDRDCKYYLKRPAKVPENLKPILEDYIEFAKLNENFVNVKSTNEVKLPENYEKMKDFSNEKLDEICEKIYSAIDEGKIEKLLEIEL